jgi:hypothetical protein
MESTWHNTRRDPEIGIRPFLRSGWGIPTEPHQEIRRRPIRVVCGDHHECLFCAVAKFFRPGYQSNLVGLWLPALGAQAGEVIVDGGGFTRFRRATATPFNMVLEARA